MQTRSIPPSRRKMIRTRARRGCHVWPWVGAGLGVATIIAPARMSSSFEAGILLGCTVMVVVLLLAGSRVGGRLGVLLSGVALALPARVEGPPVLQFALACTIGFPFVAAAALVRVAPIDSVSGRLGYLCSWCGAKKVRRQAVRLDCGALAALLGATGVLAVMITVVKATPASDALLPLLWMAAGIGLLAFAEMASAAMPLLGGALGLSIPPLFISPWRARSVGEFWSGRWNLPAAELFRRFTYAPLARQSRMGAVVFTFGVSAVAHTLLALLVLKDWTMALLCGSFFLVQPLALALERRLRVSQWKLLARRVWTLTLLAIPSPLFLEPMLRIVGPGWGGATDGLFPALCGLGSVLVLCGAITTATWATRRATCGLGEGEFQPRG